ncbi:MAG TPA: GNAT family N-acetyltransferase [Myxococcota bacterium]|nr:GNAT family N-acetyltransferase [Myxococcota bacterium]
MRSASRLEAFWAQRLGCAEAAFAVAGPTLVPHPRGNSLYAFATASSLVVMAPPPLHAAIARLADPRALVTREGAQALAPISRLVGPARIAYLHRTVSNAAEAIALASARDPRLQRLRAAVTAEEWRHANLDAAEGPLFAAEAGGEIAAAAGWERLLDAVAHIGVLAHPAQRGRGLARRAVQAAAAAAQAQGLLAQYQTLVSNVPALAIAAALAFEPFATTLSADFSP